MLLTGGLLNATTVLQPQFLQQTIGYTATNAGFSLSAGRTGADFCHADRRPAGEPVSGAQPDHLRLPVIYIWVLFLATRLNLGISFNFASIMRVVQVIPYSLRLYLGDHGGVFRDSVGEEQPGFGIDQFLQEHRRQHSYLDHQRYGDGARPLAPGPDAEISDPNRSLTFTTE